MMSIIDGEACDCRQKNSTAYYLLHQSTVVLWSARYRACAIMVQRLHLSCVESDILREPERRSARLTKAASTQLSSPRSGRAGYITARVVKICFGYQTEQLTDDGRKDGAGRRSGFYVREIWA